MACPFCKLSEKQRRLYESKYSFVIFSNPRLMPGHLLVIPKRHVERLKELRKEERLDLLETLDQFCDNVLKFSQGYTLKNNFMPFLAESRLKVDHLHIHIYPRNIDDDLYKKVLFNDKLLWKNLEEKEIKKYKKLMQ